MTRLSKAILIAVGALLAIVVLLILSVNLYVQSPGAQARLQAELSKALKVPLVITNTSFTPWSDLRINGITIPAEHGNFLEAASFTAGYKLLPLLQKRLVIYGMRIDSPKIVWTQNAEGKWVLPSLPKAPASSVEKKVEASKTEPKTAASTKPAKSEFQVTLDGFKITRGSIEMIDKYAKRVALLSDIEMNYTTVSAEKIEGTITIASASYAGVGTFENVHSPFKWEAKQFDLSALEAAVAGGALHASLQLKPEAKDSPFVASVKFANLDAGRLATEFGWEAGQIGGTLSGALDVHGDSRAIERMEGKGEFTMQNGQLRQLELFQTIGQLLQIEELANLRLKNAHAAFHLADEKAFIDGMQLEASELRISGQGMVRFDGKLAIDARLGVRETLLKKLPSFARDAFTETDDGLPALGFKISGKTDKPKTDLAEKFIGKKLSDQFGSLVSDLFGGGKKKKEDEKKKDDKKKKKKDEMPDGEPAEQPATSPAGRPGAGVAPLEREGSTAPPAQ